jgi:hypothetical protein
VSADDSTLEHLEDVYRRWLPTMGVYPLRVAVGGYAANLLPGDPVWVNTIGGSGAGKTETMHVLDRAPLVRRMSAITGEAALLSGSPKKDHAKDAVGGVLAEIGPHGVLVLKDFTTVLAMHHEKRGAILAALREIYDGSWTRDAGVEGGRKLAWSGKLGLVTGCTGAWDRAHAVTAQLGERFLTPRIPEQNRNQLAIDAIGNAGRERQMRTELAEAGAAVFDRLTPPELVSLAVDRVNTLAGWADVVTLARSPVDRDYQGELEFIPDPEAPTRFAKALAQLYQGFVAIDLRDDVAWATVARVALDCMPKLRRRCIVALVQTPGASTSSIAERTGHPTRSTRRALEELVAHGLADRDGADEQRHRWTLTSRATAAFATLSAARIEAT